jgi:ribosomal protein S18 acetylase RimI-like enzyme
LGLLPQCFAEEFEVTGFDPNHVREMVDRMFGIFGRLFLNLSKLLGRESARFFVAEVDNKIVGTTIVDNSGRVGYVSTVMVHPVYRKKGIATRLLKGAVEYVQKKKRNKVVLHVNSTNTTAKSVYAKLGFKRFECITHLVGETDSLLKPRNVGPVQVRLFQKNDTNEVCNLIKTSGDPDHLTIFGFDRNDLKTPSLQRIIHMSTEKRLVATKNGRITGYAEVSYTTPKEAGRIGNICVSLENMSTGIEIALISEAIDQIRQVGAKKIRATVPTTKEESIETLQNLGFRKCLHVEGMFLDLD